MSDTTLPRKWRLEIDFQDKENHNHRLSTVVEGESGPDILDQVRAHEDIERINNIIITPILETE